MVERLVVVGGDAAGMAAASQAKRRAGDALEVVALERGHHTSYSACGIPYWVAGDVPGVDALLARTPEQHRRNGIDLRTRTEVTAVDLDRREVEAHDLTARRTYRLGFDHLVLGTGAVPVRPPVPGIDARGVFGLQTLDDGQAVIDWLADLEAGVDAGAAPTRRFQGVVVGAGYIGVEMAEALVRHGLVVTVVDKAPEPMTTLDPDMGRLVHREMEGMGIDVRTGTAVESFETDAAGRVRRVALAGGERLPADVVVLGLGVRPNTAVARGAGLPLGSSGGIRTDLRMAVPGYDGVWAAGDCVESIHRLSGQRVVVALGTHANKQGRVAGINLGGGYATFPGVIGTAITKICSLEVARTGLSEREADQAGYRFVTAVVDSTTKAGYFPGAAQIRLKLIAEQRTGRLLGAQIVGREDAAKRIDVLATAIWNEMDVDEVLSLDLSYAPPFSPVWDPVLIAARKAFDAVDAGARSPDDQPG